MSDEQPLWEDYAKRINNLILPVHQSIKWKFFL